MSEWISVKDSLPYPFVDILAYCTNATDLTYEKGEKYCAIDRWCIWMDGEEPSFRTDRFFGKVTHWMPLPEAPKGSDGDDAGYK